MTAALFDDYLHLYRRMFGPAVSERNWTVSLSLGHGVSAIAVPEGSGGLVAGKLGAWECHAPALFLPATRSRWAFLADSDGSVPHDLDREVELLGNQKCLPLPPSQIDGKAVRWARAPRPDQPWLPTLCTVLNAVEAVLRPPTRGRRGSPA